MNKPGDEHSTSLEDVKQLGLFAAIASLSYVFWVVGAMEMVERAAFYAVKGTAALYVSNAEKDGGLGVSAGEFASKDEFSRELLVEHLQVGTANLSSTEAQQIVDSIPNGEAFNWLVAVTGQSPESLTDALYQTHNIQVVWYVMGCVGIISALGIYLYGRWILQSAARRERQAG